MVRPKPQAALTKAPSREHPAILESSASTPAPGATPPPSPPPTATSAQAPDAEQTVMFSARVARSLRTRVRRYAVDSELSLQAVTEAALREYLDNHEEK